MAPVKGNKEHNPWGWVTTTKPEDITIEHLNLVYRVIKFSYCQEAARRNCKRNPYCLFGLGEKKWVQNDEGEENGDESEFRVDGQYAGLQNLGATCYVNSLLQLWFHNPILRPAILKWTPNLTIEEKKNYRPKCAISQLQAMFARMKCSKRSKIDPTEFVTSLQLDTTEQQDAQEFSKLFMEVVVNMLTEYEDEDIRNLIRSSFNGKLQNETECLGCHNKTHREESFSELELNVKKALQDSLKELLQDELLNGTEQYFCCSCNKKQDANRRTILLSLPPVLNLQLMRFVFDRETYRKKKVTTFMQFPEIIDMSEYIKFPTSRRKESPKVIYHLNAVLVHNGTSASSGHYVAQIKDIRTGIWHKFNDENVDQVSKKNSKNLILADDEPNVKSRGRGKLAEGIHTSNGAYMLVYTLDSHVKNPEPDPEIPPYLFEMVREEDFRYEQEFRITKAERDQEAAVKLKRRKQVDLLYGNSLQKQLSKDKTADVTASLCSDDEDFQPKKTKKKSEKGKMFSEDEEGTPKSSKKSLNGTISEDEDFKPKKSKKARCNGDNEVSSTSNHVGEHTEENLVNKKETVIENFGDIDFLPVEWLQKLLDPEVAVVPICDNSCIECEHKKLAPPNPSWNAVPYRIVPSSFADEICATYGVSPRFRGCESYCIKCVRKECKRLRGLTELEEDYKLCQELIKKSDALCAQFLKTKANYSEDFLLDKLWVGKESLRKWKRMAKLSIEGTQSSESQEELDDNSNSDSMSGVFNSEIVCDHENLLPDPNIRKIITLESWSIFEKYFKDARAVHAANAQECNECINERQQNTKAVQELKEQAIFQKQTLNDLYHGRNRPDTEQKGVFYVVPLNFVEAWRKFIRDAAKNDMNIKILNKSLLCQHDKFMYSLTFTDSLAIENNNMDSYEDFICLLTAFEWETLKIMYSFDIEIKIVIDEPSNRRGISYDPELCIECATEWWMSLLQKVFIYENAPIYVYRRDKNEETAPDNDPTEEDDFQLPAKRERREKDKYDPSVQSALQLSAQAIRRSQRPRRQRGEKTYKVSSDTTIKELKFLIYGDFKAIPSDQHLFHHDIELLNTALTLQDAQIPSGATIFLEIDTVCNNNEPMDVTPETGFRGTLLLGSRDINSSSSPARLQQPSSPQVTSSATIL